MRGRPIAAYAHPKLQDVASLQRILLSHGIGKQASGRLFVWMLRASVANVEPSVIQSILLPMHLDYL